MKNAAKLLKDKLPQLREAFGTLAKNEVLVGVPRDDAARKDEDPSKPQMNNATLAYIHDNGSPAANIPARPFMRPGIEAAQKQISEFMGNGASQVLQGNAGAVDRALAKAGLTAQASIRNTINEGIAPELKESTLRGRIRQGVAVKGAKAELAARDAGEAAGSHAKPLIATGQLRNSINYVIRGKK